MACEEAPFSWEELPDDIWRHILSFIDCAKDVVSLAMVAKTCVGLNRIVVSNSVLWPHILSSFLHGASVETSPGKSPVVVFPTVMKDCEKGVYELCSFSLNPTQARDATRSLCKVLPARCFSEAIFENLEIPKHNLRSSPSPHSTSFFRLCGAYDSSIFHNQAMLSVVGDDLDVVFGLSEGDILSIQDISGLNESSGLPVNYVVSTALGNILEKQSLDPVQSFRRLEILLSGRQQALLQRTQTFHEAANDSGLLLPKTRRHISERMFCSGKWTMDYSLRFLRNSQNGLREEARERDLQRYLIAKTSLSMSAYSCLSSMFVSGRISELLQAKDEVSLEYTVSNLEELDFAYRKTCYHFLKSSVLRASRSREHCTPQYIAQYVHRYMTVLMENAMGQYQHEQDGIPKCALDWKGGYESDLTDEDIDSFAGDDELMSWDETDKCQDKHGSWYVIENANDGRYEGMKVFNVDELWDFSLAAQEIRKWSYFLYACCSFACSPTSSGASTNIHLDSSSIPGSVYTALEAMLRAITNWRSFFAKSDEHWNQLGNSDFIYAVVSNEEFCCDVWASSPGYTGTDFWSLQSKPSRTEKQYKCTTGKCFDVESLTISEGHRQLKRKLSDFLKPKTDCDVT